MGLYLKGRGGFQFIPVPMMESGICLPYDVKNLSLIKVGEEKWVVAVANNDRVRVFKVAGMGNEGMNNE